MKILLLGSNGQVGWELQRSLSPLGEIIVCDRQRANLEDLEGLRLLIESVSPEVIVNAAAYTAVDKAESEPEKAFLINGAAVGLIAQSAKKLGAHFVHYSTDYVFDGSKEAPYFESDSVSPLNVYGQSKLAGEEAIASSGCDYYLFRTSWVYGQHGNNFIKTILRLAQERDELKIVGDQYGAPTSAELIADITAHVVKTLRDGQNHKSGIYHLAASGKTNWFEFERYILTQDQERGLTTKLIPGNISMITSEKYSVLAERPKNSELNLGKICKEFGLTVPNWKFHASRAVSQIIKI